MNQIVPMNFGPLATSFQGVAVENDLGAGVQAGFGLIGYRGKVWSIRYRGDERQLMRDDGDGPRGSIEVVILKASSAVSKIWYENGYTEGSHASPDCFSTNGLAPDMSSPKKQSVACANCPMNAWGSRVTPAGKAGKACSDSKRLAVAPLGDITNEVYGGPLLLRVPAASLQDLAQFGAMLGKMGYPYYSVGVRISFDPAESYPKFVFNAIRPLTNEEAAMVIELQSSTQVDRILAEGSELQPAQGAVQSPNTIFEQPPMTGPAPSIYAPAAASSGATSPTAMVPAPASPAPQASVSQGGGAAGAGFGMVSAPVSRELVSQPVTAEGKAIPPTTGQGSTTAAPAATPTGPASPDLMSSMTLDPATQPPQTEVSPTGGVASAPADIGSMDFEAALDKQLAILLP